MSSNTFRMTGMEIEMKVMNIGWALFKFVYLPLGIYCGVFNETATLKMLIPGVAETVMDFFSIDPYGATGVAFQILTFPAAVIAWMVPEGAVLALAGPAAILGHVGIVCFVLMMCWFLSPPRFLVKS